MHLIRLALVLTFATLSASAADGHFERTLSVSPTVALNVATGSGYIHITPGSDNQVHISAHIHGTGSWLGLGGNFEARIHQIESNPPIQQSGNTLTLGDSHDSGLYNDIGIDYDIQSPRTAVLQAHTGSGDVQVEETGPGTSIVTGSGSIRANRLHGSATLKTGSGDIQLQQASAGDVNAQTGSGSIRINGFSGGLQAKTGSGDIQVEGHITAGWALHTGSGSIRLGIGSDAHAIIDADTGSGSVHISLPVSVSHIDSEKHHIHATINGGGPLLKAATGSGDVEIH